MSPWLTVVSRGWAFLLALFQAITKRSERRKNTTESQQAQTLNTLEQTNDVQKDIIQSLVDEKTTPVISSPTSVNKKSLWDKLKTGGF